MFKNDRKRTSSFTSAQRDVPARHATAARSQRSAAQSYGRAEAAQSYGLRRKAAKRRRILPIVLAVVLVFILSGVASAAVYLWNADHGLKRSNALDNAAQIGDLTSTPTSDIDMLVMGLDSRLDVNGNELPREMYEALNSGDANSGGLNSNVLIYIHIPANGSGATAISIPRDDYVDIPGSPDNQNKAKVKEAYGLAADQKSKELASQGITGNDAYQQMREAGRTAEVATVNKMLGVHINHFVEVTMASFFQVAQVLQPITVCLKQDTVDTVSGADFKAGEQEISAKQAVAFVRQRRDTSNPNLQFTDLDRSRRQQAFIISVLTKLKQTGSIADLGKINDLIGIAQSSMVVDKDLNLWDLVSMLSKIEGSSMHFYTLPVKKFGYNEAGQSINEVDVDQIKDIVKSILNGSYDSSSSDGDGDNNSASNDWGKNYTISVANASGKDGYAGKVIKQLGDFGFSPGKASTAVETQKNSVVNFAPGSTDVADQLASLLGNIKTVEDKTLSKGELRLTIGTSFSWQYSSSDSSQSNNSATTNDSVPQAVDATGGGEAGPEPSDLTDMVGGGIPCVK